MKSINVLSLFDGISCGQVALGRAVIKVNKYFASEIDKDAIKVTQHNYPDTIQLGDVCKVNAKDLPKVDLLMGGSPCQDLSRANYSGKGLEGESSKLFWEFVRLKNEIKPNYFFLENVTGIKEEDMQIITREMGVMPVKIDSSLVSAQLRERYYWTNIPGEDMDLFGVKRIRQPEDRGITLQSILESGVADREKARCLLVSDSRPLTTPQNMIHRYFDTGFTTLIFKDNETLLRVKEATEKGFVDIEEGQGVDLSFPTSRTRRGRAMRNKIHTITKTKNEYYIFEKGDLRYLTQLELERCQTLPEGYTKVLTRNKAAACIGNGWTVDIIAHIFKGIKT